MKTSLLIFSLIYLVSCSSVPKTGDVKTDSVIEHISQGPKVIGKDWDEKFTKDGFIDGEYVAIGSARSSDLHFNNKPLRLNAETDAMARLLRSAPTDFKRVVQKVLNSLANSDGYSTENMIAISEVRALTGMKSNFDDVQCVQTAYPSQDLKWRFEKECRLILRIDAAKLNEAYDFTLEKKYSIKRKNEIDNLINQELTKQMDDMSKVSSNP